MKILKRFGKKNKRNEMLLKEYEEERVLQIDNNVDNKEYLKQRGEEDGNS